MRRKLGADEALLWARVAATVRRVGEPAMPPELPRVRPIRDAGPGAPPPPVRARAADRVAVDAATLDGAWDKTIRRGRLEPDAEIDLHGYTAARARALLEARITGAAAAGQRVLLIVTGKGRADDEERPRGVIRAALPGWLEEPALRPYVAALRPAHPRHGGAGAFYLVLRRG